MVLFPSKTLIIKNDILNDITTEDTQLHGIMIHITTDAATAA